MTIYILGDGSKKFDPDEPDRVAEAMNKEVEAEAKREALEKSQAKIQEAAKAPEPKSIDDVVKSSMHSSDYPPKSSWRDKFGSWRKKYDLSRYFGVTFLGGSITYGIYSAITGISEGIDAPSKFMPNFSQQLIIGSILGGIAGAVTTD